MEIAEYRRRFHFIHSLASAPVRTAPRFLRAISMSLGDVRVPPTPLATARRATRAAPTPRIRAKTPAAPRRAPEASSAFSRRRPRRARGGHPSRWAPSRWDASRGVRLSRAHPAEPRARVTAQRRGDDSSVDSESLNAATRETAPPPRPSPERAATSYDGNRKRPRRRARSKTQASSSSASSSSSAASSTSASSSPSESPSSTTGGDARTARTSTVARPPRFETDDTIRASPPNSASETGPGDGVAGVAGVLAGVLGRPRGNVAGRRRRRPAFEEAPAPATPSPPPPPSAPPRTRARVLDGIHRVTQRVPHVF